VAGLDPGSHPAPGGARNLIAEVRGAMNGDGSFGVNDMVFSHALAVVALARTNGGAPIQAVNWMVNQRCADVSSPNLGAFGWAAGCGSADVDVTALAVEALVAAGRPATDPALSQAAAYLATQQDPAGAFASWGAANANSTGTAAGALALVPGYEAATGRAATYIGSLQVTCATLGSTTALNEAALGAIAYDTQGLADAAEYGLDSTVADQFRRATSQAVLALGNAGLGRLTLQGGAAATPVRTCAQGVPSPDDAALTPPLTAAGTEDAALAALAGLLVLVGSALLMRRRSLAERALRGRA
jgi:hypothetical protein